MTNDDKVARMLRGILSAKEDDVNCDDCFEQLDQFVELVQAGGDAAILLPRIEAHINWCNGCHEEYQALLSVLRSELGSDEV